EGAERVEGLLAGARARAEAECVLPRQQPQSQGAWPLLRGQLERARHRPAHVPDQCRTGRQTPAWRHLDLPAAGAAVMGILYLAALLLSLGCMALLDWRFSLFFWRDALRAAIVLVVGVVFFVAWDLAGIGLDIFFRGETEIMTGVLLAPELP